MHGRGRSHSRSPEKAAAVVQIEMPKLDVLVIGPSQVGKTTLVKAFAKEQEQEELFAGNELQVGMSVKSQLYSMPIGH